MRKKQNELRWMIPLVIAVYLSFFFINIANNMLDNNMEMPKKLTGSVTGVVRIFINETCGAPGIPTLNQVKDTRDNSITMSWITRRNSTEIDQFVLDDEAAITTKSPITKTLSRREHTWKVRTCNSVCCSAYAEDTFRILPSYPVHVGIAVMGNITPPAPAAPEVRVPSPVKVTAKDIVQNLLKVAYLMLTLTIAFILFGVLMKRWVFIGKKGLRREKLAEYITSALRKGFSESQIRDRLKESTATEEEIDRAFEEIRKLKEFRTR